MPQILKNHIVPGEVLNTSELQSQAAPLPTLTGQDLQVHCCHSLQTVVRLVVTTMRTLLQLPATEHAGTSKQPTTRSPTLLLFLRQQHELRAAHGSGESTSQRPADSILACFVG